jgi:hypothetical protein
VAYVNRNVCLDALLVEQRAHAVREPEGRESRVGDDQDLPEPETTRVEADLLGRAETKLDRRHLHDEDGLGRQRDALHGD